MKEWVHVREREAGLLRMRADGRSGLCTRTGRN